MNPGEHEVMAEVEERHWWYRGLRDAVVSAVRSAGAPLPEHPRVLDAGCGTGTSSELAQSRGASVTGLDASQGLLDTARK